MKGNKNNRVTLKDVAHVSGLSLATVSNALAGRSSVKEETRKKLMGVAEDLGYRSSSLARSLRTGKTGSIGFLIADITAPYYTEVIRGAEDVLLGNGYFLLIGNSDYDAARERSYINHYIDRQVEGIFLVPHSLYSESVALVREAGIPLILLNRKHDSISNDLVGVDYQDTTHTALNYLWELGHRKIGVMVAASDSSVTRDRLDSITSFIRHNGVSSETIVTQSFGYHTTVEGGRQAVGELLTQHRDITAIFAQDNVAVGVLTGLSEMGFRVPEDISVIGLDGLSLTDLPQINLTTMHVARRDLGRMAAEMMLERIRNPSDVLKILQVRATLVVRGTTAPPPSRRG